MEESSPDHLLDVSSMKNILDTYIPLGRETETREIQIVSSQSKS